jgi:hypothetical protein
MKLRCAACRRRLLAPAFVGIGGYMLGPTCARRAGKLQPKRKSPAKAAPTVIHEGQFELFA